MERASVLLARQLPAVHKIRGTEHPSMHRDLVAARFMEHWLSFREEVLHALSLTNLTNMVSGDSSEGDKYVVGNELSVSSRIINNICDPVMRALAATHLSDLRFADIHTVVSNPSKIPDVILLSLSPSDATMILGVGEYKTWWTVDLHSFPITGHNDQRGYLEPFVGKLSRPPKTLFCLSF